MKLNQCDSCGKQAPQVDIGVMRPTADGADGWVVLNIHVHRKSTPPSYIGSAPLGKGEAYYTNLVSQIDLCPDCAGRTLAATGCIEKVMTVIPGREETAPTVLAAANE